MLLRNAPVPVGSTVVGVLQELPLNVVALAPSTATQKETEAQETELGPGFGLIVLGALHAPPLYVSALPFASTATQNDVDGQETDTSPGVVSMLTGALQALPL